MGKTIKKCVAYLVVSAVLFTLSTIWYISIISSEEYERLKEIYEIDCTLDIYNNEYETDRATESRRELQSATETPTVCMVISAVLLVYSSIVMNKVYLSKSIEKKRSYIKATLEDELQFCNDMAKQVSGIVNRMHLTGSIIELFALCEKQTGRALRECNANYQEESNAIYYEEVEKRVSSFALAEFPTSINGFPNYYNELRRKSQRIANQLEKFPSLTDNDIERLYWQHKNTIEYIHKTHRVMCHSQGAKKMEQNMYDLYK